VKRQGELKISEANAGAPDSYRDAGMHSLSRLYRDQPANEQACISGSLFLRQLSDLFY